ncbi:acetoacetate--CoA ligase [Nocardioides sp. GY 10113]|uniref:acetoacetate--CoA ligase n=1 Tax=Nocardioides sp. GY 10113 TaxID=2569761 RepID=UPI001F0EDB6D|nr:acetoacetate--CoA ligase [Nocardioides sp. GY 10113]
MTAPDWTPAALPQRPARIDQFASLQGIDGEGSGTERYDRLWRWSVAEPDAFWRAVADYLGEDLPGPALAEERMPGADWFPDARLNYTATVFRDRPDDEVAVIACTEDPSATVRLTWAQLRDQVASLAATFRDLGVSRGDRVVGFLPNGAEAVVSLLATASVGATWAVCGMDYAASAARARFEQLEPTLLVHASSYLHGGRPHDRGDVVAELVGALPSLRATLEIGTDGWAAAVGRDAELTPEPVPFDHPLWVLFSSGTTGRPKGIVHGHGGAVLEQGKLAALHFDLGPGERLLWYTTPSWMMWNFLVGALLTGASVVAYDGSPARPGPDGLWALAAEHEVSVLGMSPGYVAACQKAGVGPAGHDLHGLRMVGISGSTFPAGSHRELQASLGTGVQICSISGGTDVVSAFVGAVPTVPVWAGELSRPCLGVALDAYDPAGHPVRGEVGELVVTRPMPSMPVAFWDDADGSRYREAYFDTFPGVWRHGDWITLTDHGSVVIHGRSDATLNRNGIRMGSGDIYEPVEALPEVAEALVIGVEQPDGGYWMPLFVVLAEGAELDDALRQRITTAIRTHASPRHVPDDVYAAPGIPHTRTGKKLEVPVKKVLAGKDLSGSFDPGSVDAPDLLEWYAEVARQRRG